MPTARRRTSDRGAGPPWVPVGAVAVALAIGIAVSAGGGSGLVVATTSPSTTTTGTTPTTPTTGTTPPPTPTPTTKPPTTDTTPPPTTPPTEALRWTPPSVINITRHISTSVSLCTPAPRPPRACGEVGATTNPSGRSGPYWFDDEFSEYALPPGVSLDPNTGKVAGYTDGFGSCVDTDSCEPSGEGGPTDVHPGGEQGAVDPPCRNESVCEYEWLVCVSASDGPPREVCEPVTVRVHS